MINRKKILLIIYILFEIYNERYIIQCLYILCIQLLTGIISIYGIFIPLRFKDLILRDILILETIVQCIEFIFYIWLVISLHKIKYDVTYVRYFDWFWTTPVMLLSTVYYFEYINKEASSIVEITIKDFSYLSWIVISNFLCFCLDIWVK